MYIDAFITHIHISKEKETSKEKNNQRSFEALGSFDKINCTKKLFLVNFSLYCQKHIKECLIATHYLSFLKRDLSQTNHWRIFSSLFCKKRANYDE